MNGKLGDLVLAAGVVSLAPLGVAAAAPSDRATPVVVSVAALHVVAAVLLVRRTPSRRPGRVSGAVASLPSFAAGAVALAWAPEPSHWPAAAVALFAAGAALAAASLLHLGRSFAVFPASRPLVTSGPYAIVRNPALAGEVAMVAACCAARPCTATFAAFAACVPAAALRVAAEERELADRPRWAAYAARTRWRLVPCVW